MKQVKVKVSSKTSPWKLSKREFGQFRKKYKIDEKYRYDEMLNYLKKSYVYYLNDLGLSVNFDGSTVEKDCAQYMWTTLDKTYKDEPLYAWMCNKGDGVFGNIRVGTRVDFDQEIARILKNKK